MSCGPDEKDITSNKLGAKFGISIITIIYFVFILFIIGVILSINANKQTVPKTTTTTIANVTNTSPKNKYADSFVGRFTEWFTKVGNSINSGSVLAILAAGVVIGFNNLIMTPIISTMFPIDITEAISIPGRVASVYPGQFFIALIGFILSLILFFFVAELIHIIRRNFKRSLTFIIIILLFLFLTFMLIWNAIETDKLLKQPDCVPLSTTTAAFQLKTQMQTPTPIKVNPPPPFGIFG